LEAVTLIIGSFPALPPFAVPRLSIKIDHFTSLNPLHLLFHKNTIQKLNILGATLGQLLHNAVVHDGRMCKKLDSFSVQLHDDKTLETLISFLKLCPNLRMLIIEVPEPRKVAFPSEPLSLRIVPGLGEFVGPRISKDFFSKGRKVSFLALSTRPTVEKNATMPTREDSSTRANHQF